MRRVRTFLALERDQRRLVVEAVLCLGAAGGAVSWLPFRWFSGSLGHARAGSPLDQHSETSPTVERVAWAIRLASRHLPWTSTCLMRAMAGQWMLRRRGVAGTVHLGVSRNAASGEWLAHAWLRAGGRVLLGEAELRQGYTAVASFSDEGRSPAPSRPVERFPAAD
jgi:hypothetical protein